ncbi:MAG: hypothetical protein LBL87_05110, partial [Ruminococcus sp.]|nr:hypothetical protein [Ruminococcus sp.]
MDGLLPIQPQPAQTIEIMPPVGKNGAAQSSGIPGLPNLSDTTVVGQTNTSESTDADHSGSDLASDSHGPRVSSYSQRDPAVGARIMRAAFGSDTLASIAESGDTKLLNKVTEFAQEIMLRRDNIGTDFKQQQDESTVLGKDLWRSLNDLLKGRDVTVPEAKAGTPGQVPDGKNAQNMQGTQNAGETLENLMKPPAEAPKLPSFSNMNKVTANSLLAAAGNLSGEQLKAAIDSKEANAALGGKLNTAFKQAVVDLIRTAVAVESKTDTAASLSSNLRFLAAEAAPSVEVRNRLNTIANELTAENFPKLKDEIQSLLGKTAGSLHLNN